MIDNDKYIHVEAPDIKQTLTNLTGKLTIPLGDFSDPQSAMDRSSGHKISKGTLHVSHAFDQMGPTDVCRAFYPQQQQAHSSQTHTQHSPGQATGQAIKQVLANLRLKSYQVSFCTVTV